MEINKQLFEDVLSGKLKGTFVLRNKQKISSNELICNNSYYSETHPYRLLNVTYTSNGLSSPFDSEFINDIIDFIPDTDMKENELTIEIPNDKVVDWQESAKQEKIVFKKKNTKPRSWEEYCFQRNESEEKGFYINEDSGIESSKCPGIRFKCFDYWRNVLPSKELAEAFLAMMQLMSLRQEWIGDWKPNWKNGGTEKWCIMFQEDELTVAFFYNYAIPLSFPTQEIAEDFMNTFKNLLDVAKPLI